MTFFDAATAPFAIALMIMGAIALLELLGLMFGVAFSGLVDSALPDLELDADMDNDMASDVDGSAGFLNMVLAWLYVGKVPVLIFLAAFLASFGLAGILIQNVLLGAAGFALPVLFAAMLAFLAALPVTRMLAIGLSKIMPREETDAVSTESFIGRTALVFRGMATQGAPAEAKLTDAKGLTQYILVEPDEAGANFAEGAQVIITEQNGAVYRAIRNLNETLNTQ